MAFQRDAFQEDAFDEDPQLGQRSNITARGIWRALKRVAQPRRLFVQQETTGTVSGSFTADAITKKTQSASFTADAVLRRAQSSSFTADAVVNLGFAGSFTAYAVLRATVSGSFTADAVIAALDGPPGYPRKQITAASRYRRQKRIAPQVKRRQTLRTPFFVGGSFTADAVLAEHNTFRLDAVIVKLIWDDDFSRSQNPGWGRQYLNVDFGVTFFHFPDPSYVNGSGHVDYLLGQGTNAVGYARPRSGIIQFDFWVGADTGDFNTYYGIEGAAGAGFENTLIDVYPEDGLGLWTIETWPGITTSFTPDPSTWYRVKGLFYGTAGADIALKVWRAADPEPAAWLATGSHGVASWFSSRIYAYPFEAEDGAIDNIRIWTLDSTWQFEGAFRVDAVIVTPGLHFGFFTASAVIKATATSSFTADAVKRRGRTGSFTANAFIGAYHAGSFTADAWFLATINDTLTSTTFTADAIIYNPAFPYQSDPLPGGGGSAGSGGSGGGGRHIVIRYDGVDITSDVVLHDAVFITKTNGAVGEAKFFVRDNIHSFDFVTGKELTVDIDDFRAWGGYVVRAKKTFFFPAQDTTDDQEVVRGWEVNGVDYNVLFQKRVVFSSAHPTTKIAFEYSVDLYDDQIIRNIFDNYLDLTGLGITRSGVTRVDKPIFDIPGNNHRGAIASAGDTWAQAMQAIARATGAVFYISPTKVLTYTDVDTTGPWTLTDQPSGTWDVRYRDLDITFNGTSLINDMMVWGAAIGSDHIVFKRTEDTTSISDHGRWQQGLFSQALYRQSSTNRIANSYVYGSPLNKRGGKDDQVSFVCTTFYPRFYAGMKMRCVSAIYDYDDVVPLRTVELTFPSKPSQPDTVIPMLRMTVSHEIDEPWNTAEWLWKDWDPNIRIPHIIIDPPPPLTPPPGDCECGITDTFTRTIATDSSTYAYPGTLGPLGTSEAGIVYRVARYNGTGSFAVDGSEVDIGMTITNASSPAFVATLEGIWPTQYNVVKSVEFRLSALPVGSKELHLGGKMCDRGWSLVVDVRTGVGSPFSQFGFPVSSFTVIPTAFWVAGTTYTVTQVDTGVNITNTISDGVTTYSVSLGSPHTSPTFEDISFAAEGEANAITSSQTLTVTFDNFDVPEVTRCSENRFDNFNRTISDTYPYATDVLGISDIGSVWHNNLGGTGTSVNVASSLAVFGQPSNTSPTGQSLQSFDVFGTPISSGSITMRFKTDFIGTGANGTGATYVQLYLGFAQAWLVMSTGGGGAVFPGEFRFAADGAFQEIAKTDWVADTFYLLKIAVVEGGVASMTLWAEGDTEPAPQLTDTYTGTTDGDITIQFTNRAHNTGSNTVTVDYIDFDYDGKPCAGLVCSVVDDFNRSVVSGDWGTSSSGPVWVISDFNGGSLASATDYSVDGNYGIIDLDFDTPAAVLSGTGPWSEDHWMMTSRFKTYTTIPAYPSPGDHGDVYYASLHDYGGGLSEVTTLVLFIGGAGYGGIDTSFSIVQSFTWAADTWYTLKWEHIGATQRMKVWADGDAEPAWLVEGTDPADVVEGFAVWGNTNNTPYIHTQDTIEFCLEDFPSGGIISGGYVCESPADTGDQRHFQLNNALSSGSSQVFVDGVRQSKPSDYTEDPNAGQIIFGRVLDIPEADSVYVCYTANGAPI